MDMNDGGPIDLSDKTTINIGISIEPTPQAEQLIQQSKISNSTSLVQIKPLEPARQPLPRVCLTIQQRWQIRLSDMLTIIWLVS